MFLCLTLRRVTKKKLVTRSISSSVLADRMILCVLRFVASWIDTTRDDESEKAMLTVMFDKYIPSLLESCKKYKRITPLTELQQIQLTCYLLECFLNKALLPSDCPKEW